MEIKKQFCADCGKPIGEDQGPSDGWLLEDGRIVCHACSAHDLLEMAKNAKTWMESLKGHPAKPPVH